MPIMETNNPGIARFGSSFLNFNPFMVAAEALECKIDEAVISRLSGKVGVGVACSGKWKISDDATTSAASDAFVDLLESEIARVTEYILQERRQLEASARSLLVSTDATLCDISKGSLGDVAQKLHSQADQISNQSLALHRFTKENSDILRDAAANADARLGTSCMTFVNSKLATSLWTKESGIIVTILSDIYDTIRVAKESSARDAKMNDVKGIKWTAPATFKRKTHKYLVQNDKIAEVLHAVVVNMPLLIYGRTGRLTPYKTEGTARVSDGSYLWDNLVTPVSSVYFDSPDMVLYHDRIVRNEGARLLRVRWYGEQPEGDEVLFLELKTHHEKWVDAKSVKERVSIRNCDMHAFLAVDKDWGVTEAEAAIVAADHTLKGDDLKRGIELLLEMHNMVHELNLRPCIRTNYLRAAFQSPRNNDLRLTLDRNITMIDESGSGGRDWCLSDGTSIGMGSITQLPCAIFEVKESEHADTAFIDELFQTGVIADGHKFSKYLTGAAAFNQVRIMPYWAQISTVSSVFNTRTPTDDSSAPTDKNAFIRDGSMCASPGLHKVNNHQKLLVDDKSGKSDHGNLQAIESCVLDQSNFNTNVKNIGNQQKRDDKRCWWYLIHGLTDFFTCKSEGKSKASVRRPARVEPKSYFANERTFIQWITAALWLVTIAFILLEMEVDNSMTVGLVLCIVAMIISIYALATYFRRVELLQSKKPYGYIDHTGPVVLTLAILVGIIVLLYFTYLSSNLERFNGETIQMADECIQYEIRNISKLEYQPSDIIVDEERGILLVPSLSLITAMPLVDENTSNEGVSILADVPEKEFEGVTYVNKKLYAVSEDDSKSELIEFEWDDGGNTLVVSGQWEIPTPGTEGIVYIPDPNGGKLYISGDRLALGNSKNERAVLHIYDVPSSENIGKLKPVSRLNMNLMTQGLEDNKIASMTYFEDVLYILHDNAHVVRAWDIMGGELLSEWKIPRAGAGYENQWEGLGFQWVNVTHSNKEDSHLRNGGKKSAASSEKNTESTLFLYLTLDSPPQIWKIAVNPGKEPSSISLPTCASVE